MSAGRTATRTQALRSLLPTLAELPDERPAFALYPELRNGMATKGRKERRARLLTPNGSGENSPTASPSRPGPFVFYAPFRG